MLIRDVADALSAKFVGDGSLAIDRIVHPAFADKASDLAVAMTAETFGALAQSKAQAVVISTKTAPPDRFKAIIVAGPERETFAKLTALFDGGPAHATGVHPTAIVASDAVIGAGASIGAYCVIGPRSRIGAGTAILPQVSIGADVTIGANGLVYSGVRIGDRVSIGSHVILHYNAVVGSDGFSFVPVRRTNGGAPSNEPTRIHSLGGVTIGDHVEIGAGTTVARGTLSDTRIGSGTKIDNHVQIAHNVTLGEGCLIAGMAGIAGSTEVGDRVLVGGGAGIADHIRIESDAVVAAGAGVGSNVKPGQIVSGMPAMPHDRTREFWVFIARHKRVLADLERVKTRLEALEKGAKQPGGSHE